MRVEAAALNFADILYTAGEYQERVPPPFTPGLEVAGVTDDGRRVFGPVTMPHGGFAEEAVLRTTWPWPEGMSAAQAAGFFVAYQTGWCALHHRTTLRRGRDAARPGRRGRGGGGRGAARSAPPARG